MSEFLRRIFAENGDGEKVSVGDISGVFDAAVRAGQTHLEALLKESQPYAKKGGYFEATIFLFVAVWTMVRGVYSGVESANKKDGPRNPVNHMWSAIRTAFSSIHEKVSAPRMLNFEKRWKEGFYDEWH